MNSKVEALASKAGQSLAPRKSKNRKKGGNTLATSMAISEEIEEELNELEERINNVDKILQNHNSSINTTGEQEESSEDEDSDDSFLSSDEDEEEEEEFEQRETSLSSALSDSQHVLTKLNEMKNQLQVTNDKIRDMD